MITMNFDEFKTIKDQQMVVGPALIPDKDIVRSNEYGEYHIKFSKSYIENMVKEFNRGENNLSINVGPSNEIIDGYIIESWIVKDQIYDKSGKYGFDLPIGSWFVCIKTNKIDKV